MPKRFITVGGIRVEVKSENEGHLTDVYMDNFGNAITLYVQNANAWVLHTLGREHAEVRDLLQKYFKTDTVAAYATVMSVLRRTRDGMQAPQKIKIRSLGGGLTGMAGGGFFGEHRKRIYLDIYAIAKYRVHGMEDVGTRLYLHEATHSFAETNDHGDKGYLEERADFKCANDPYRAAGLTPKQALNNADSYAGFVNQVVMPD